MKANKSIKAVKCSQNFSSLSSFTEVLWEGEAQAAQLAVQMEDIL